MALPASFAQQGFVEASKLRKRRRVMIGTDGDTETGKTEFIASAPGPSIILCLDRGYEAMLDNATPPPTRNKDVAFKAIKVPLATTGTQTDYLEYWKSFYRDYIAATSNADCATVGIDGDSDSWELQRLAEFGKLTQVPDIMYVNVNAARRAMIARGFDSGKNIIATNKLKREYVDDPNGGVGSDGKPKRVWSGEYERQGFRDQNYLWQVQIRHLHKPATYNKILKKQLPKNYGIRITKCKANSDLVGEELWGDDCNFAGLVSLVYPQYDLGEWGFK